MTNNQNNKPAMSSKGDVTYDADEPGNLSIKQKSYINIYPGKDWEALISKHKLRYDIWMLLNLYHELNVSQIIKWVKQSKSTVSRVLIGMKSDELLVSRRGKVKEGE